MVASHEDIVRRISANWDRGDFSSDTELFHGDVEFEMRMGVEHARARGLDEMGRAWREQLAQWSYWRTDGVQDLRSSGNQVLLQNVIRGRGRHSDVEVERSAFAVFTFRDGLVVSLVLIDDRDAAFAEAGIEP